MDTWILGVAIILASIAFYRKLARWRMTPKTRVNGLLRRYRTIEKSGLSEQDCLLKLLGTRKDWKKLPEKFLYEIVSRLSTKEDVMRFVSVSEDFRYQLDNYPTLGETVDLEESMSRVACLFARFGYQLQEQGRYKEAEFVQKLALQLESEEYFTNLPLATNYYETGRYADALPLFKRGLDRLVDFENKEDSATMEFSPNNCLGINSNIRNLRNRYKKLYEACLKTAAGSGD